MGAEPILNPHNHTAKQTKCALDRIKLVFERRGASAESWYGPGTPLVGACHAKDRNFVEVLINANADPNSSDEKGVTALHNTAFEGSSDLCQLLCERNADPNALDIIGQTPLFFAQRRSVCDVLLKFKADLNVLNRNGQSAVHAAAIAASAD